MPRLIDHTVRKRIMTLRAELGLSQRALATSGVTSTYLSHIENGKKRPSIEVLIILADRLHTSALYLLTGNHRGRCPVCRRGMSSIPNRDGHHPNLPW